MSTLAMDGIQTKNESKFQNSLLREGSGSKPNEEVASQSTTHHPIGTRKGNW